jgi:hypothetical protein
MGLRKLPFATGTAPTGLTAGVELTTGGSEFGIRDSFPGIHVLATSRAIISLNSAHFADVRAWLNTKAPTRESTPFTL